MVGCGWGELRADIPKLPKNEEYIIDVNDTVRDHIAITVGGAVGVGAADAIASEGAAACEALVDRCQQATITNAACPNWQALAFVRDSISWVHIKCTAENLAHIGDSVTIAVSK